MSSMQGPGHLRLVPAQRERRRVRVATVKWFKSAARKKGELQHPLKLSATTINVGLDCDRCLWLKAHGYSRPSFPVASITGGVDRVAKELCDMHRGAGTLPVMLDRKIQATLHPRKPPVYNLYDPDFDCILVAKLDEAVIDDLGAAPMDHKSCNRPPDLVRSSVQLQLDLYSYVMSRSGQYPKMSRYAYLVYHFPIVAAPPSGGGERCAGVMGFGSEVRRVEVDHDNAREMIRSTIEIITGEEPEADPDCPYCAWASLKL